MSDAKTRRVNIQGIFRWFNEEKRIGIDATEKGTFVDDPNGTHYLAPVDHYKVVTKETLERVIEYLQRIEKRGRKALELEITLLAQDILKEIGGGGE